MCEKCENEDGQALFAVIKVVGDYYGGVDEVECVGSFNTYEEADLYVERYGGYIVRVK